MWQSTIGSMVCCKSCRWEFTIIRSSLWNWLLTRHITPTSSPQLYNRGLPQRAEGFSAICSLLTPLFIASATQHHTPILTKVVLFFCCLKQSRAQRHLQVHNLWGFQRLPIAKELVVQLLHRHFISIHSQAPDWGQLFDPLHHFEDSFLKEVVIALDPTNKTCLWKKRDILNTKVLYSTTQKYHKNNFTGQIECFYTVLYMPHK